jgi:hypothetical protein
MQRHFNTFVPLSCPHCSAELWPTLDDVHDLQSLRCDRCGTWIDLSPGDLPLPFQFGSEGMEWLHG